MNLGNRIIGITISYGKRQLDVSSVDIDELKAVNIKANISFDGQNYKNRDSVFYVADAVKVKVTGGFIYEVDSVDLVPHISHIATGAAALDNFEEHYFESMEDEVSIDIRFVDGSPLRLVVPRTSDSFIDFSEVNGGYLTIASCNKCRSIPYCACTTVR